MPSPLTWYRTLRHLKFRQCRYLLWRPLAMALARRRVPAPGQCAKALPQGEVALFPLPAHPCYNPDERSFSFLTITQHFPEKIAWDFRQHGLLWAYHLNYFEWLYDDALTAEARLETMRDFAKASVTKVGDDAYPTSLRIIAWTRFLLRFDVNEKELLRRLSGDAEWLRRFPEFQLDGNHLFENALALTVAGVFFHNARFYEKGRRLLRACIDEQILPDGAHAEGSAMYHSQLLCRMMQCIEIMRALPFADDGLEELLLRTAAKMLGWCRAVAFSDGSWPQFNDSAPGMAPPLCALNAFADAVSISAIPAILGASGYRMLRAGDFELAIHASAPQPAFQPGHAHADVGSFCLHYRGQPLIVDTGISTYEANACRLQERGTAAHNTVAIGGENSSELWRAFRIGGRATRLVIEASVGEATVRYSPWKFPECVHCRRFVLTDEFLRIEDELSGTFPAVSTASLHFASGISPAVGNDKKWLLDDLEIQSSEPVRPGSCRLADGFGRQRDARCARISFTNSLIIEIVRTRC